MKKAELVFIPSPIRGHLASALEVAKLLVDRDGRLSITFLIMKSSFDTNVDRCIESFSSSSNRIKFIYLPNRFEFHTIETQKPHVKDEVSKLLPHPESTPDSPRLAGFVLDVFCTTMIDVANEFGVPSYIFITSGAAYLGLQFYLQELYDDLKVDLTEFKGSDVELLMPCLVNPLPAKVLPSPFVNKDWLSFALSHARRFREAKGIIVNTFEELESHAINSLSDCRTPPVYPVGPVLNLNHDGHDVGSDKNKISEGIMRWLDDQPPSSVLFLCFGSMGGFDVEQVQEIAVALEHSGYRFLWAIRQPPRSGKEEAQSDYVNLQDVLPEGFLDRTVEIGKVIGWAPQVDVLGHPSVQGFVSHCGWNSILESIWFGVPIATWPMYAEQQFNAFQLVVELKLAVEIKMDYRKEFMLESEDFVRAEEIEGGIKRLMELEGVKREQLKTISEKSRKALIDGGSSHAWLGRLIQDMMENML